LASLLERYINLIFSMKARLRGLRDEQIIFTDIAPRAEHLKRGYLADLFLDTPAYNAHTTGCDILWSGTPLLTLRDAKMASRVGASLLTAAGLGEELVTTTAEEYEDLGELSYTLQSLM
jgi:protein O-GlcNAc transferase